MNDDLSRLHEYPFEKLARLKSQVAAPAGDIKHISLSIGEPKHPPPEFVLDTLRQNLSELSVYPSTKGSLELRQSIARWLCRRYQLQAIDPEQQVLPVNGTREALFSFAQAVIDRGKSSPDKPPLVISPNPFYQIYEGAAFLAGADLRFANCKAETQYLPNFEQISASDWQRCQLLYLCSPGNPSGAVVPKQQLQNLIELAHRFDFVIASDECYSEIYFDDVPPTGLLQAANDMGNNNFSRCVVFHSLSKRSNLPGLRSGFVAGDAELLKPYLLYRTYHGCAMPQPTQLASIAAWNDEQHVIANRQKYREKFDAVINILQDATTVSKPDASFYLWLQTPIDEQKFAQQLYARENVTVLPGSYLSRPTDDGNPGEHHVRIALVANLEECIDAANRLKRFITNL